jgi:5'-deoxynucleotidase YfbR-like HD superfamily hydrolase
MSAVRTPGLITTISGAGIDLTTFDEDSVSILDIAWGLGRTLRYGGHLVEDYTVAHHSIIMSYYVPEEYALEALLHDAGEAYMGDIIWPVKQLFPELERFENGLTMSIMNSFNVPTALRDDDTGVYRKSDVVRMADRDLLEHECFEIGRAGVFHPEVEKAWLEAALTHQEYWPASQFAFLQRFRQLIGEVEDPLDLRKDGTLASLDLIWFKLKPEEVREHNQELIDQIVEEDQRRQKEYKEMQEALNEEFIGGRDYEW